MARPVIVSRFNYITKEYDAVGTALFHTFGCDYDESDNGPGNYSVAIVEWPDGKLESFPTHCIQFVNPHVSSQAPAPDTNEISDLVKFLDEEAKVNSVCGNALPFDARDHLIECSGKYTRVSALLQQAYLK